MTRMVVMASVAALALTGCQQYGAKDNATGGAAAMNGAAEGGDASAAVTAAEADMLAAFKAKDAAKLTSHYASDAVLAIPGRTVKGADAITKANSDDLKDPAFALDFTNERTDASGDLAYTSGSYKVTYTDAKTKKVVKGQGTYVTVFKKQADGSWKAVADIATPTEG
jgi:uncharacterized protein (TIGR02246 family)